MQNPQSYVSSNIAGFVNLLEVAKTANPQPAIVWASSSSVYGLNSKVPFSESDRTDQPASLYAATKKAGEEIAHTYNHIYGLSLTGLRFFTVYGPWGRPDMAYFFFTKDILQGKPIDVYQTQDKKQVARDFTYIDDVVKGCLGGFGHGGEEHRKWWQKERTCPIESLQSRQHLAGSCCEIGVDIGRVIEHESKETCDQDAKKRGCALHACECHSGIQGFWTRVKKESDVKTGHPEESA
ncbi:hypothetical protein OIU85_007380 [Salix viminalis]|uniref:NAD-dependent epimerase/dehydratase domain-containing protein n=1 Tax=Salix viminalis TaxID=40686 RepID=A0A9Q0P8N4_SALVM|nr:hypothetical protein OIU85_007380 [Salix viminalis]